MSARIYNIHFAKTYESLEKMTITKGQLEMIYQLIERGVCQADSREDARLFADIGDLLIEFCKPEGSK